TKDVSQKFIRTNSIRKSVAISKNTYMAGAISCGEFENLFAYLYRMSLNACVCPTLHELKNILRKLIFQHLIGWKESLYAVSFGDTIKVSTQGNGARLF